MKKSKIKKNSVLAVFLCFLFLGSYLIILKNENYINNFSFSSYNQNLKSNQISVNFNKILRPQKKDSPFLILDSKSALAASLTIENINLKPKILYQSNPQKILPIASISKLMTAVIVLENYPLNKKVKISKEAVLTYGESGRLKEGEVLSVENLLYIMLIESSNDAAEALSRIDDRKKFIDKMNKKAEELAMESSYFSNPSGLDFEDNDINYSSANDLLKLVVYILKEHPKIGEILSLKQYNLYSQNGYFHHHLLNTNQMLEENNTLWGKTGSTLRAKDCLINLTKKDDYFIIITIVLGAGDKFEETRKLNTWIDSAFLW